MSAVLEKPVNQPYKHGFVTLCTVGDAAIT